MVSRSGEAPFDLHLSQDAVPLRPRPLLHRLEGRAVRDLLAQVVLRLVETDEGGGQAERHRPVLARVEAEVALHAGRAAVRDRCVEDPVHEEPGRARRQSGLHIREARDDPRVLVQGQARLVRHVVEEDARVVAGIGEAQHRRVVGRCHLGLDAVLEAHPVVVRPGRLVLVPESQRPCCAARFGCAGGGGGHHLEGLPVAHPGARLMTRAERLDGRQVVRVVGPRVVVQPAQ